MQKLQASKKMHLIFTTLFFVFLLIDQLTKYLATAFLSAGNEVKLIPNILHLTYLRNKGAAWGILQEQFVLFSIITVVVVIGLFLYYLRIPKEKKYNFFRFTIILLAAGALGNFIDRALYQYVVDFIYVKAINFPIFNFADMYVSISAILLVYCIFIRYKDEELTWKKK